MRAVDSANPLSALFSVNETQSIDTEVDVLQSAPLRDIVSPKSGFDAYAITVTKFCTNTYVIQVAAEANSPSMA